MSSRRGMWCIISSVTRQSFMNQIMSQIWSNIRRHRWIWRKWFRVNSAEIIRGPWRPLHRVFMVLFQQTDPSPLSYANEASPQSVSPPPPPDNSMSPQSNAVIQHRLTRSDGVNTPSNYRKWFQLEPDGTWAASHAKSISNAILLLSSRPFWSSMPDRKLKPNMRYPERKWLLLDERQMLFSRHRLLPNLADGLG